MHTSSAVEVLLCGYPPFLADTDPQVLAMVRRCGAQLVKARCAKTSNGNYPFFQNNPHIFKGSFSIARVPENRRSEGSQMPIVFWKTIPIRINSHRGASFFVLTSLEVGGVDTTRWHFFWVRLVSEKGEP